MATTKRSAKVEVNKAQLIRDAFEKHGLEATAAQVQEFCESKGAKNVAPAQISNIRQVLKGNGPSAKRAKIDATTFTASELQVAKAFAEKCGGVVRAIELLTILSKLS